MITVRRNAERLHDRQRSRDVWQTFRTADRDDPLYGEQPFSSAFGLLEGITEERLPARTSTSKHSQSSAEMVTYVQEGALAFESSLGRAGIIQAGEFQHLIVGNGVHQTQRNSSTTSSARVFRMSFRLSMKDLAPGLAQRRFSTAERRGTLCTVASPDGRRASLRTRQDVLVHSAILAAGQHVAYALAPGRSAWLHVVCGTTALGDVVLTTGDGAGLTNEIAVSLTARDECEILLVELGARAVPASE